MAETTYTYAITDFPNQKLDIPKLTEEILDSSITIALDHIDFISNTCKIIFKDQLPTEQKTTLDNIVAAHDGEPIDESILGPRMPDGRLIVRSDSRPLDFQTVYTMRGDDSTAGIGQGVQLLWDFSNDDNLVTGPHVPPGYKCKEFILTFLCPVYIKDGCLYFFDAPWGQYAEMGVVIPPNSWYPNPAGTVPASMLGLPGEDMYANTGSEWVTWATYVVEHRMYGSCPMGDELNAEGATVNPIPPGWGIRGRIYTPESDNISKGYGELEVYRCHSVLLPGQTVEDIINSHS